MVDVRLSRGTALSEAESPVISCVKGIGTVFVVLGRRILDGKPGVFPARRDTIIAPGLHRARKE